MGKSARYIGSSDAPPILGVPSYGVTALDVWERMVGLAPAEREPSAEMRWGILLEPLILADFATQSGRKLDRRRRRFYHPDHPFLGCTVDARAGEAIVEAKSSPWDRDYGEPADGPMGLPLYVRTQVQHQMMVTGAPVTYVPVLLRGHDLRTFEVPADPVMHRDMLEELVEWHQTYVVGRTPPPVDDQDAVERYLRRRNARDDGTAILASPGVAAVARRWAEAVRDEKDAKARIKAIKNIIRDTMGDAAKLTGLEFEVSNKSYPSIDVAWELVAGSYRKRLEELDVAGVELDTIRGIYTSTSSGRKMFVRWFGQLKELVGGPRDTGEESTDVVSADA